MQIRVVGEYGKADQSPNRPEQHPDQDSEAPETFLDLICGPIGQGSLFQHQVMHYDPKHTEEIAPRYPELGKRPVQLIWGADDAWQVVDWAHKLHGTIPGSELHVLEDCGHFAMEDQPEQISALLVDFLNRQG